MYGLQQTSMGYSPFNAYQGMPGPLGGMPTQQGLMNSLLGQMMQVMLMMSQMFMANQMQSMVSSMPQFGGGASGLNNGIGNFLGGSPSPSSVASGGTGALSGSSAPMATSSDFGPVAPWGQALAKDAEKNANGPGGWCFKWVRQALERAGVKGVGGASAYMAADQLAKNPKFREIKVSPKDLPKLPAGAVVVWDRGGSGASSAGRTHGHISISLGDGREVSDKVRQQTTSMGSNVRVFLPK